MEGIVRHLRGRLPYALRSYWANGLTRRRQCLFEFIPHLIHEIVELLMCKMIIEQLLAGDIHPQMNLEYLNATTAHTSYMHT